VQDARLKRKAYHRFRIACTIGDIEKMLTEGNVHEALLKMKDADKPLERVHLGEDDEKGRGKARRLPRMWIIIRGRFVEENKMRGIRRARALRADVEGDLSRFMHPFQDWRDRFRGIGD